MISRVKTRRCWWRWLGFALGLGLVLIVQLPWSQALGTSPEAVPVPVVEEVAPAEGLFFADVVVRNQPVFQIGGLSDLSATERAQIVNRRIASVLAQNRNQTVRTVTVQPDPVRGIATLQVNNRVLMTVTQQDSQDFNLPIEELAQRWSEQLTQAFEQPPLAIDVGQRLYSTVRQFQRDVIDQLPALIGAVLVVVMTWLLAVSVRHLMMTGAQHWEVDHNSKALVSRLGYGAVWVVGSIVALGVLGLDFGTLVGTLGLTSVAIGFSLRDVLSNYFSGVVLLASRPFRLGDQIVLNDYEGTVTQIQLRATTIKTYDGRTVFIPNQEVFNSSIVNNTTATVRRSAFMVGIDFGADINQVKQIMREAVLATIGVEPDPPPEILVRELGASAVKIEVRVWVNSRRLSFLESTSRAAQAVKEALQQAGIGMPTEIYTVKLQAPLADVADSADGQIALALPLSAASRQASNSSTSESSTPRSQEDHDQL
ncbi:mechanosensitive ion channel family protein [Pseudanabaena sp. FACHB-2040]|uniref:mechanosensitive ion channel family protein n=1 Tax=Pseudanabaena sp. FACHB-2040 TaxID=2692859 RepID=UPI0016848195|nr:mechanosensitive ion channel family protein [Pseudanabaena sp. FACHB-2040]MBD2258791.1 mechanosensitive ion channel family protein [Pseudanabaena sp. FACHB-2040]